MKNTLLSLLAAVAVLCSCSEKKASVPLYGWEGIGKNPNLEEVRARFQNYKSHGFTGVCINAALEDIPALSPSPMRKASSTTPGSPACCRAASRMTGTP